MEINSMLALEPTPKGSNLHMGKRVYPQTSKKTKYHEMKSTTQDIMKHVHDFLKLT